MKGCQVGEVMFHTQSPFVVSVSVTAILPVGAHVTSTVDIAGSEPLVENQWLSAILSNG
jgi:hypothetical protein